VKFSQLLSLIILLVCLYIFWQIRNILLLTFAAVIFAVVLNRAVIFLQRWTPSRNVAVAVTVGIIFLLLGIFGFIIVPPFATQLQELIRLAPEVINRLQRWLQGLEQIGPISLDGAQGVDYSI